MNRYALFGVTLLVVNAIPVDASLARPLELQSWRVPLNARDATQTQIGVLEYRGGIKVTSPDERFGGLSGLLVTANGRRLLAVSDHGYWLSADIQYDSRGFLQGLSGGAYGPLHGPDGSKLSHSRSQTDAEALARLGDGGIIVTFERQHRLWRYPGHRPSFREPPIPLPTPANLEHAPGNEGIEALAALGSGRLFAITEGLAVGPDRVAAWLGGERRWSRLSYTLTGGFKPTGATTLPSGDVLVLERRYDPLRGAAARIQLVAHIDIRPGARVRGRELARFVPPVSVDNFEGIAARQGMDETLVYILSDDNFNNVQRTLLFMLALPLSQ